MTQDQKLAVLRDSITFQGIDSAASQNFGQERAVGHSGSWPGWAIQLAARVANDLAQSVLDMSASGARDRAEKNVAFFTEKKRAAFGT